MASTPKYTVRVGADGASKFSSDSYPEALAFAIDLSKTNWSGQAYIREHGFNVVRVRNGEIEWVDRSFQPA